MNKNFLKLWHIFINLLSRIKDRYWNNKTKNIKFKKQNTLTYIGAVRASDPILSIYIHSTSQLHAHILYIQLKRK